MLKTRVISSVIGLAILFLVFYLGNIPLSLAVLALSIIGLNEFYNSVSNIGLRPVYIVGYLFSIPVIWLATFEVNKSFEILSLCAFVSMMLLFMFIVFKHEKFSIVDISVSVFGMAYIPFLFSYIIKTRALEDGNLLVWLIFIGAWATDTFAYFAGRLFGKHKIMPVISPKKSLEGSIGGVIGCILFMILYGIFYNSNNKIIDIDTLHFIIIGLLCGILSQVGDWSASAIKRSVKVKDYGKIMPGHGGVLDRFDSILFVAPIIYFYAVLVLDFTIM